MKAGVYTRGIWKPQQTQPVTHDKFDKQKLSRNWTWGDLRILLACPNAHNRRWIMYCPRTFEFGTFGCVYITTFSSRCPEKSLVFVYKVFPFSICPPACRVRVITKTRFLLFWGKWGYLHSFLPSFLPTNQRPHDKGQWRFLLSRVSLTTTYITRGNERGMQETPPKTHTQNRGFSHVRTSYEQL